MEINEPTLKNMKESEFFKNLEKAIEHWRKQNSNLLDEVTRGFPTIQNSTIPLLTDLGESITTLKTMQEQICKSALNFKFETPLSKTICEANLNMSEVLTSLIPFPDTIHQLLKQPNFLDKIIKTPIITLPQTLLSQQLDIAKAITKNFSLITNSAVFAQQAISALNLESIGEAFNIGLNSQLDLCKSITDMANSYHDFWKIFSDKPQSFFTVPLVVTKIPSIEMSIATYQAEISVKKPKILSDEEEFIATIEPDDRNMKQILALVDPSLIPIYEGAISALKSNNPDYIRHFTTSLRELCTHTLHKLAPDKKFFEWDENKSYLDEKGRPTREGRLRYISRNINYIPFNTFIESDISTALKFLQLFQRGTHAIKGPFSMKQSKAMLIRMKCLIMYLIEISRDT